MRHGRLRVDEVQDRRRDLRRRLGIPVNHAYMLNTDYLELVVHTDADMAIMEEMKPLNQDGAVVPILWMGNLVCSNRSLQVVVKA
jgi:hypothetical protein